MKTALNWRGIGAVSAGSSFLLSAGLPPHPIHMKGLQQPRGWGFFDAIGLAGNLNRISASTACLLAFNNPARRPV
jgi:hypothetical protein